MARGIYTTYNQNPNVTIDIPILHDNVLTYHVKVHAFIDTVYEANIDPPNILIVVEHDVEHHQQKTSIYNQIMTLYGSYIDKWYVSDHPLAKSEFIIPGMRRGGTRKRRFKNKKKKTYKLK